MAKFPCDEPLYVIDNLIKPLQERLLGINVCLSLRSAFRVSMPWAFWYRWWDHWYWRSIEIRFIALSLGRVEMGGQTINVVIISSEYEQTEQVQLCKLLPYQEILFYCQQLKSAQSQTSQTEKVKRRQQKSYPTIRNLGLSVIDNSNEINFHHKKKKELWDLLKDQAIRSECLQLIRSSGVLERNRTPLVTGWRNKRWNDWQTQNGMHHWPFHSNPHTLCKPPWNYQQN